MKERILRRLLRILESHSTKHDKELKIHDHYIDALIQNGDYFYVDIDKCVDPYGFSYGSGWHFFTSIVFHIDSISEKEISRDFASFIRKKHHENAYDGFGIEFKGSDGLKKYSPASLAFLTPWSVTNLTQLEARIASIVREEKLQNDSSPDNKNPLNDPEHLASNHYSRLYELRESILSKGYQLNSVLDDPIKGFVLHRNGAYRILIFNGQHRVATLAGLKHRSIPIKFASKYIIDAQDADKWPLVRNGLWDIDDALHYFHYLFDFNSYEWATRQGLRTYTLMESFQ